VDSGSLDPSQDSEYGWAQWFYDNEQDQFYNRLKHKYNVVLQTDAKILFIDTKQKLIEFTDEYKKPDTRYSTGTRFSCSDETMWESIIDWMQVTSRYDGLLISPYQHSIRWQYKWYYGFDCASGCIWNLSCIDTLTQN
jgi:hypothetical protein